jgi:hypothetical protein
VKALDFGDRVIGRVCQDDDQFHLARPARIVSGLVTGIYPYSPKHATVLTATGEKCVVRVGAK